MHLADLTTAYGDIKQQHSYPALVDFLRYRNDRPLAREAIWLYTGRNVE